MGGRETLVSVLFFYGQCISASLFLICVLFVSNHGFNRGSWQERQIYDRDLQVLAAASSRERQEFYLPLVFYLFAFLNFFMTVPRRWTAIERQRSFDQQESNAKPAATDWRFKAGSFLAVACLLIICYSLGHSIYRYKKPPTSRLRLGIFFYLTSAPSKLIVAIILATIRVGYGVASSFVWSISPLKYNVSSGWLYGLGYGPILLILIAFNIYGYMDPNEDKALIQQRTERNHAINAQLGIDPRRKKPSWWRKSKPDLGNVSATEPNSILRSLGTEIGGGKPTHRNFERYVEMDNLRVRGGNHAGGKDAEEPTKPARENPFQDRDSINGRGSLLVSESRSTRIISNAGSQLTTSSGETRTAQAKPQVVRSMLDI